MNLWRDIPAGDRPPDLVNVVVEVISGSRDKYEYNIEWKTFVLDRVLHSSVVFQSSTALFRKHGLATMIP